VITTSIGLPHKAYNVRRNPRVALLYSDPTGSGLDSRPEVLVLEYEPLKAEAKRREAAW
jgi:hypothetical protein